MKETFLNIKNQVMRRFGQNGPSQATSERYEQMGGTEGHGGGDYIELSETYTETYSDDKVLVRPFTLADFEDIKPILDDLRNGNTIALINIAPLKEKDIVELKRAVNKIKKTCDACDGDIAGFGDDYIVATPARARVHRGSGAFGGGAAAGQAGDMPDIEEY